MKVNSINYEALILQQPLVSHYTKTKKDSLLAGCFQVLREQTVGPINSQLSSSLFSQVLREQIVGPIDRQLSSSLFPVAMGDNASAEQMSVGC